MFTQSAPSSAPIFGHPAPSLVSPRNLDAVAGADHDDPQSSPTRLTQRFRELLLPSSRPAVSPSSPNPTRPTQTARNESSDRPAPISLTRSSSQSAQPSDSSTSFTHHPASSLLRRRTLHEPLRLRRNQSREQPPAASSASSTSRLGVLIPTRRRSPDNNHPQSHLSDTDCSAPSAENTTAASGTNTAMTRTRTAATADEAVAAAPVQVPTASPTSPAIPPEVGPALLPSIRFTPYVDTRTHRPSLTFQTISRTLPTGAETIRVGRYSERDGHAPVPPGTASAAPVGFKSKVVSRRHCEFWCEDGRWYIRDVKSSSGTFLNHIRLSPPGTESKPFMINDGDIVQLGIDFKGGEEMIFRCVKMRLELNRGWQTKLNAFNMSAHSKLRNMAKSGASSSYSQDCSICLNSIAPCQSLFVAPCSHTWHYKCIRSLLSSNTYPIFICPNCRAAHDLEDDPEELEMSLEEWQKLPAELRDEGNNTAAEPAATDSATPSAQPSAFLAPPGPTQTAQPPAAASAPSANTANPTFNGTPALHSADPDTAILTSTAIGTSIDPVPIPNARPVTGLTDAQRAHHSRTQTPNGIPSMNGEGPITPRNDAGPWVFDGSAGRAPAAAANPENGSQLPSLNQAMNIE